MNTKQRNAYPINAETIQSLLDKLSEREGENLQNKKNLLLTWAAAEVQEFDLKKKLAELHRCRPNMSHAKPCVPLGDGFECNCGCAGDDTWCGGDDYQQRADKRIKTLEARLAEFRTLQKNLFLYNAWGIRVKFREIFKDEDKK